MSGVMTKQDETVPALLNGTSAMARRRARVGEFSGDTRGGVLVPFALMGVVLFSLVGGAVDLGRWLHARDQTISAIDAAVLAAGRALQTDPANVSGALDIARNYYAANTQTRLATIEDTVDFEVINSGGVIQATGGVKIKTPLLGITDMAGLDLNKLPLFDEDEAPQAIIKQESDIGWNREISLMLDVSGSMSSNNKLRDMKLAAVDLVNLVMKDPAAETWTKMAIVPFSGDVRPPASMLSQTAVPLTSAVGATTGLWPDKRAVVSGGGGGKGHDDDDDDDAPVYDYYWRSLCVAERTGASAYTNVAPGANSSNTMAPGAGNYVMPTYVKSTSSSPNRSSLCSTPATGEMAPLSNSKTAILAKINGLTTGGGTAGHLGTAWAYYMLSPEWNAVLPAANQTLPYGTEKLKKIAILMTDGEYNFQYDAKGYATSLNVAGNSANGQTSAEQAVEICGKMKEDGIEVYTVGFDLGDNATAISTLADCASGTDHAYITENGTQLKAAFRDIAIKLTELHLLR